MSSSTVYIATTVVILDRPNLKLKRPLLLFLSHYSVVLDSMSEYKTNSFAVLLQAFFRSEGERRGSVLSTKHFFVSRRLKASHLGNI